MPSQTNLTEPCVRCGYDIRGQEDMGRCRECGLRVELSRFARMPDWFERSWLVRLRRGTKLIFISQILLLLTWVLSIANDLYRVTYIPFFTLMLAAVVASGSAAMWLMTEPALFAQLDRWWGWVRRAMRLTCLAPAAAGLFVIGNYFRPVIHPLAAVVLLVLVWLPCIALTFAYLSGVCDRLRAAVLASRARLVMWSLPGVMFAAPAALAMLWAFYRISPSGAAFIITASLGSVSFIATYAISLITLAKIGPAMDVANSR